MDPGPALAVTRRDCMPHTLPSAVQRVSVGRSAAPPEVGCCAGCVHVAACMGQPCHIPGLGTCAPVRPGPPGLRQAAVGCEPAAQALRQPTPGFTGHAGQPSDSPSLQHALQRTHPQHARRAGNVTHRTAAAQPNCVLWVRSSTACPGLSASALLVLCAGAVAQGRALLP